MSRFGSAPYWPQPGYLYARSRPHGSVPQPMGDYTHGGFTPKIPWAIPEYARSREPMDDYYDFGGFGGTIEVGGVSITCDVGALIDKIVTTVSSAIIQPTGNSILDAGISLARTTLENAAKAQLNALGGNVIDQLMVATGKGTAEFKTAFTSAIAPALSNAVVNYTKVAVTPEQVYNMVGQPVYNTVMAHLKSCGASVGAASSGPAVGSQIPGTNMCWGVYNGQYIPVACGETIETVDITQWTAAKQLLNQNANIGPDELAARLNVDPRVAAGMIQAYNPAAAASTSPYSTPPTATGGGGGGVAVIGLAALAALFLLK